MNLEEAAFNLADRMLDADRSGRMSIANESGLPPEAIALAMAIVEGAEADSESPLDKPIPDAFPSLVQPQSFEKVGFRVVREIGRGGMGVVYLAEDIRLSRMVALKAIGIADFGGRAEQRFLREARAAARLDHPHVLPVYSAGIAGDVPYVVSAYIEDGALSQRLATLRDQAGVSRDDRSPLPKDAEAAGPRWAWQAAQVVRDIARAVHFAHSRGVIHRDIKPGNILLADGVTPLLADFGVAAVADEPSITMSHERVGTLRYMSPEQAGVRKESPGPASDIYALGATLFECLTLRTPYRASNVGELTSEINKCLVPNPRKLNRRIPRALAWTCLRALEIDPSKRFADAAEMANSLEAALSGHLRTPLPLVYNTTSFANRRPLLLAATGTALCGIIAASIYLTPHRPQGSLQVSAPSNAVLSIRPIDAQTRLPGPPIAEAQSQIDRTLPVGNYRIIASSPTGVFEKLALITEDASTELTINEIHPLDTTDMVLIDGGEYVVGAGTSLSPARTVEIDPFWIDQSEVTNAQYRVFVDATSAMPSTLWPEPYDPSLDDLPVVGIDWDSAVEYAAWAGKRLPTDVEWEIAAAGKARDARPIEITRSTLWTGATEFDPAGAAWFEQDISPERRAVVVAGIDAARRSLAGRDITESGIEHMLGSVREWTESWRETPESSLVILKGYSWADPVSDAWDFQSSVISPTSPSTKLGFRCAASAKP